MSGENPQKLRIAMETENKLRLNEAACLYPPKKFNWKHSKLKFPWRTPNPFPYLR